MNTHNTPDPAGPEHPHQALLEWTAPRSHAHERSVRWYKVGAGVVIGAAVYAILTGAWSLAIVVALVGGMYFLIRKEPPALHTMRIEETGLMYDGTFLQWGDFDEAWFVQTNAGPQLHVRRKKGSPRELILLVHQFDQTLIRTTLSRFLKVGSDRHEHLLDVLIRLARL